MFERIYMKPKVDLIELFQSMPAHNLTICCITSTGPFWLRFIAQDFSYELKLWGLFDGNWIVIFTDVQFNQEDYAPEQRNFHL